MDFGSDAVVGDFDDGKAGGTAVIKFKEFRFLFIQKVAGGDAAFVFCLFPVKFFTEFFSVFDCGLSFFSRAPGGTDTAENHLGEGVFAVVDFHNGGLMSVGGKDDRIAAHEHFCQFLITGKQPARIAGAAGNDRQMGDEKYVAHIGIGGQSVFDKFDGSFCFLKSVIEDIKVIVVDDRHPFA